MSELNTVLKQLKSNKSRDPLGFANELFKPQNAGEDLKVATLKLMNQIKTTQTIWFDKIKSKDLIIKKSWIIENP